MRDGWSETTLGELAKFRRDRIDPLSLDSADLLCHWSIPALDEFGGPLWEPAGKIGSHKFRVKENAVVFSLLNPRIPRFALVTGGDDVVCSTEFAVMQPTDLVHETFLLLLASSNVFQKVVGSLASGTTKSRERVKPSDLEGVSINLPPLEEQKRIVDVVVSVDVYIDALQQQADLARTARNAVLHELLSAGGDDWTETIVSALLSRSIGGVWGTEPGTDQEEVTVVRSTEFTKSGILNFATGVPRSIRTSQLSSRALAEGDILLEKSGGGPEQPVGRVVYVQSDIPPRFVCSNFIQLLTPVQKKVLPKFLFMVMWMWHSENKTLEYQAQTTGIRNLRTPDYLEQVISLPPLAEQNRIVEIVSSMDDVIQSTEQAVTDAKNLRSGLLSDLLSGEHEIPESYDVFVGAA